jgi:hypothetical protein
MLQRGEIAKRVLIQEFLDLNKRRNRKQNEQNKLETISHKL